MTDLGQRLAGGDEDAFTEVVKQYSRKVYALCYRTLRDEEEAKDMAQEVFVRIYTKRGSFKGRSSLYTWIYRIALNMCLTHLKKRRPGMVPLEDVERTLSAREADGPDGSAELEARLAVALKSLSPKQRAVFSMRFYDRMTYREIAEATGTTTGAAKANHHFAVKHLRKILGEGDEE
jgi:RNA polymerase sigma-70 factor (ECF subfamily)